MSDCDEILPNYTTDNVHPIQDSIGVNKPLRVKNRKYVAKFFCANYPERKRIQFTTFRVRLVE